jgi:hypothetical protein
MTGDGNAAARGRAGADGQAPVTGAAINSRIVERHQDRREGGEGDGSAHEFGICHRARHEHFRHGMLSGVLWRKIASDMKAGRTSCPAGPSIMALFD